MQSATAETKRRKMVAEEERVNAWLASLAQDSAAMEDEFQASLKEMWRPVEALLEANLQKKVPLVECEVRSEAEGEGETQKCVIHEALYIPKLV